MKEYKMELMDWKQVESHGVAQIRESLMIKTLGEILLKEARQNIKKLGGKTSDEEEEEAERELKKTT